MDDPTTKKNPTAKWINNFSKVSWRLGNVDLDNITGSLVMNTTWIADTVKILVLVEHLIPTRPPIYKISHAFSNANTEVHFK